MRSGLLAEIRWLVCMSKSHMSLCVSFSWTDAGLCIYYLFVWSNLNFLHISQWITFLTQSYLFLYSCCANFLHLLIMWLMVSSLSIHNLHLLFCCVLSILTLIRLVLLVLFCATIRRVCFFIIIIVIIIIIIIICEFSNLSYRMVFHEVLMRASHPTTVLRGSANYPRRFL